jgi:hypothetical protein
MALKIPLVIFLGESGWVALGDEEAVDRVRGLR